MTLAKEHAYAKPKANIFPKRQSVNILNYKNNLKDYSTSELNHLRSCLIDKIFQNDPEEKNSLKRIPSILEEAWKGQDFDFHTYFLTECIQYIRCIEARDNAKQILNRFIK